MSFNLVEAAKSIFTPDLVQKATTYFGESDSSISRAIAAIIPSVLGGIVNKASTTDGAAQVAALAAEANQGDMINNSGAFATGEGGGLLGLGGGLLNNLFGDSKSGLLNGLISQFSGVKSTTTSSLLSMAAPAILGLIGKHASDNNMNASGISSFLASQKPHITNAMPAGFEAASIFGPGFTSTAHVAASQPAHVVHEHTGDVEERSSATTSVLLPLLLLILAGAAAWYFFKDGCGGKNENHGHAAVSDTTRATIAPAPVETMLGRVDTATGDFIYEQGANVTLNLPNNAGTLTVGANSTENKLVNFLNNGSAALDTVKGNWFEFTNVRFTTGGSEITPSSMTQLQNLVAISKAYPTAQFKIGGYTDSTGNAASNLSLSQRRAESVAAMLKRLGIANTAVTGAQGYGKEWPLADNSTVEGRAQNRRVAVNVKAK